MDMKCGNCHRKTMKKSSHAAGSRRPRAAAQPINGGAAPGMAPTRVHRGVIRLSGVYTKRYLRSVSAATTAASAFVDRARHVIPRTDSTSPNRIPFDGGTRLD